MTNSECITKEKSMKRPKKVKTLIGAIALFTIVFIAQLIAAGISTGLTQFVAPDKSFTVMLPDNVKEQKTVVDSEMGPIEINIFTASADHQEFTVAFSMYSESFIAKSNVKTLLDGSRDGMVKNCNGKLLSETVIKMKGYSGRELKIEGPQKYILQARIYLVKNKLYQIISISEPDFSSDKMITEVFNSFKIKGM